MKHLCGTCKYCPKLQPEEVRTRWSHGREGDFILQESSLCKYPLPFFAEHYVTATDGKDCRVWKAKG